MNINTHCSLILSLALLSIVLPPMAISRQELNSAAAKHYVCAPCGLPCDAKIFDHPGTCPQCGMALVDQESAKTAAAAAKPQKKVAILIFNGVQIIDYTGPYEVFGAANFDVYTVAETKDPITTAMGMTVVPKYSFADAPNPDVLVVPGGGVHGVQESPTSLKWVTDITAHTEHTMSVCNGAFILASAGLLDGLTATTTSGNIPRLSAEFPKVKVVDDKRFVDNGRIITTAGLAAGIDGALHVVAKMLGNGTAQRVALGEEYDWRPESGFARAALADRLIPDLDLKSIGAWQIDRTQGDTRHWQLVLRGTSTLAPAALLERLDSALAATGTWTKITTATPHRSSGLTSDWKFAGRDARPWTGSLAILADTRDAGKSIVTLNIARAAN